MLLQSAKELFICGDFGSDDVFFYYTTTGWCAHYYTVPLFSLITLSRMMWNFLISALPIGLTIVLFDGSPLDNVSLLFNFVDNLKISIFGTRSFSVLGPPSAVPDLLLCSAKYLEQVAVSPPPYFVIHGLSFGVDIVA